MIETVLMWCIAGWIGTTCVDNQVKRIEAPEQVKCFIVCLDEAPALPSYTPPTWAQPQPKPQPKNDKPPPQTLDEWLRDVGVT